jgi:hypothetical protein
LDLGNNFTKKIMVINHNKRNDNTKINHNYNPYQLNENVFPKLNFDEKFKLSEARINYTIKNLNKSRKALNLLK